MDSTVLKIVQIFVSAPHLLLANMNSAVALQDAAVSPQPRSARLCSRALVCSARARRSSSLMIIWLLNFFCLGANPRNGIANAADKQAGYT